MGHFFFIFKSESSENLIRLTNCLVFNASHLSFLLNQGIYMLIYLFIWIKGFSWRCWLHVIPKPIAFSTHSVKRKSKFWSNLIKDLFIFSIFWFYHFFYVKNSSSSQIENKDVEYWQNKVKEVIKYSQTLISLINLTYLLKFVFYSLQVN